MSTLIEKFPNAINSRQLTRGTALFLTGAMLVGSLIDCEGEGPQLPTSHGDQGGDRQVERVITQEEASLPSLLGGATLVDAIQSNLDQVAVAPPSFEQAAIR